MTRLRTLYRWLRALAVVGSLLATLVVTSALMGFITDRALVRIGAGVTAGLLLPLLLRAILRRRVASRLGSYSWSSGAWFVAGWNLLLLVLICLGFSDDTGRALRRQGDWFLGQAEGRAAGLVRRGVQAISRYLERWDLPPEAKTILTDAARPQPLPPPPVAPVVPGEPPRPAVAPPVPIWFHPLAGPGRSMPRYASHRFGASRRGRRRPPPECGLGHCGIDLLQPTGTQVHAVYDGVVLKVMRAVSIGRGRFVVLAHKGGELTSEYLHLDEIADHIRVGTSLRGGEVIGTVGTSGLRHNTSHLHFALAVKPGGRGARYIDPEPLLHFWRLPAPATPHRNSIRLTAISAIPSTKP